MNPPVFGMSDVGRRRETNQDQFLIDEDHGLFAVADGMGGHAAGEVASQIAIEALGDSIQSDNENGPSEARRQLVDAVREGNRRICESVIERQEWRGMGTTVVVLRQLSDRVVIGHVGDSRAYRLRDGMLEQLTADHSYVGEQVRLGLLTHEEAHSHPMRNIVTRAMGNRQDLDVDLLEEVVRRGDIFLLCSDGLNSMLTDGEILATLKRHQDDAQAACKALIDAANERGGEDNITVIVVSPPGAENG